MEPNNVSFVSDNRINTIETEYVQNKPWRWKVLLGAFFIFLLTPTLLFSYGVFGLFIYATKPDVTIAEILCTPCVMRASLCISAPWANKIIANCDARRRLAVSTVILLSLSIFLSSFAVNNFFLYLILYSILGGMGICLVINLTESILKHHFPEYEGLLRGFCHVAHAIGQFSMPHALLSLIEAYGERGSHIITAAFFLNLVAASILLTSGKIPKQVRKPSRYSDIATTFELRSSRDDLNVSDLISNIDNNLERSWRSPSDNSALELEDSPNLRRKNNYGVEILQVIPEENESSDSENIEEDRIFTTEFDETQTDISVKDIEKKTTYSKRFRNYFKRDNKTNSDSKSTSENETFLRTVFYCCKSDTKRNSRPFIRRSVSATEINEVYRNCFENLFMCNNNNSYSNRRNQLTFTAKLKRNFNYFIDFLYDLLLLPLVSAGKIFNFYPVLLMVTTDYFVPSIVSSILPIFAKAVLHDATDREIVFIMSLGSFAWMCLLLSAPWLTGFSIGKQKYLYSAGAIVKTIGLLVISVAKTNNLLTIATVSFGVGHGITWATSDLLCRNILGNRKYTRTEGTITTLSGIISIILGLLTYICMTNESIIKYYFNLIATIQVFAILWVLLPTIRKSCYQRAYTNWEQSQLNSI